MEKTITKSLTKEDLESYWIRESQVKKFLKEYKKEIEKYTKEKKHFIVFLENLIKTRKVKVGEESYVILREKEFDELLKEMSWLERKRIGLKF